MKFGQAITVMEEQETTLTMYEACLLHARADRALRTIVSKELERYDVTMMEWLLLSTVNSGPEKGLSMSEIGKALNVTLPQVTALVSGLIKLKVVKQKTQVNDRRSRHVIVTNKGRSVVEDIENAIKGTLKEWLADIPQDDLKCYIRTVKRLATKNS